MRIRMITCTLAALSLLVMIVFSGCGGGGNPTQSAVTRGTSEVTGSRWASWGGALAHREAGTYGPHNTTTVSYDNAPTAASFYADPLICLTDTPDTRVYIPSTGGALYEFVWDTSSDLDYQTSYSNLLVSDTDCASTPCLSSDGCIWYTAGGYLVKCDTANSYSMSAITSAGSSPYASPHTSYNSGGAYAIYYEGPNNCPAGWYYNTVDSMWESSYASGFAPTYWVSEYDPLHGCMDMPSYFLGSDDAITGICGHRFLNTTGWWDCWYSTPIGVSPTGLTYGSTTSTKNAVILLHNMSWLLGECFVATPEELSTWEMDSSDYVKASSYTGYYDSLAAIDSFTESGYDVYIVETNSTSSSHWLAKYTIDAAKLTITKDTWQSQAWTTGHNHTHPTVDQDGYVYLTTLTEEEAGNTLPGIPPTMITKTEYRVYDPSSSTAPIYSDTIDTTNGDIVRSSPVIGNDHRAYVSDIYGEIHVWWDL